MTNYTGTGISAPYGITAGPDGALWFTNQGKYSIGRITTSETVTHYTGTSISNPGGITVGPDGALWFVNAGNSTIGRITTAGVVTNYTGTGISNPNDITVGPDGALWFVNAGNSTIGRITTAVTPEIDYKKPSSGVPGTEVTITGHNLSPASRSRSMAPRPISFPTRPHRSWPSCPPGPPPVG